MVALIRRGYDLRMFKVDIESMTTDRINENGRYEVEFDWSCRKCGHITKGEHAESAHLISVVSVQCKKCRRASLAVMPMLREDIS